MSPRNSELLVNEVVPRLRNTIRKVPKIGPEDDEEILQDVTLMAARLMESAEQAGHPITAGNTARPLPPQHFAGFLRFEWSVELHDAVAAFSLS